MVSRRRQLLRSQSASRFNNVFLLVSFMFEAKCPARFNLRGVSFVATFDAATLGVDDLPGLRRPGDRVWDSGVANRRVLRHATIGRRHDRPHHRWRFHRRLRRLRRHLRRLTSAKTLVMGKGAYRAYWIVFILLSTLGFAVGLYSSHMGRWDASIPSYGYQAFLMGRIFASICMLATCYGLYKLLFDKSAP